MAWFMALVTGTFAAATGLLWMMQIAVTATRLQGRVRRRIDLTEPSPAIVPAGPATMMAKGRADDAAEPTAASPRHLLPSIFAFLVLLTYLLARAA